LRRFEIRDDLQLHGVGWREQLQQLGLDDRKQ
jgi:hypothetical protein